MKIEIISKNEGLPFPLCHERELIVLEAANGKQLHPYVRVEIARNTATVSWDAHTNIAQQSIEAGTATITFMRKVYQFETSRYLSLNKIERANRILGEGPVSLCFSRSEWHGHYDSIEEAYAASCAFEGYTCQVLGDQDEVVLPHTGPNASYHRPCIREVWV